jgi:predicted phosphohydrolase
MNKLFAIGDVHLPSTRNKTMHRFGWTDHPEPLKQAWDATVQPDDFIIIAGDISWATRPNEVLDDLKWLDERPGKKVLLKGNHDFWWADSGPKLLKQLEPYKSFIGALHGKAVRAGPYLIAGTRLWTTPEAPSMPGGEMGDESQNLGFLEREGRRLEASLADALAQEAAAKAKGETLRRVIAVHFPPVYSNGKDTVFSKVIEAFKPELCVYGHLHGPGIAFGFTGPRNGTRYVLASCDAAGFKPMLLLEG